jgi:acyl carrier protein
MAMPNSNSEMIQSTILALLGPKLAAQKLGHRGVDASIQLLELGLIDSKELLDIILEVEERCAVQFNPERIDFETGLTLGGLIDAFAGP